MRKRSSRSLSSSRTPGRTGSDSPPPPPYSPGAESPDHPVYNERYHLEPHHSDHQDLHDHHHHHHLQPWISNTGRTRSRRKHEENRLFNYGKNNISIKYFFLFPRKKADISRTASQEPEPTNLEEIEYYPSENNNQNDNSEETQSDDKILLDNLGKPRNPPIISEIEEELKPENRSQSQVSFLLEEGGGRSLSSVSSRPEDSSEFTL